MYRRIFLTALMTVVVLALPAPIFAQDEGNDPDKIVVDEWSVDDEHGLAHCLGEGTTFARLKDDGSGGTHFAIHESVHATCESETGEKFQSHELIVASFSLSGDFRRGVYNTIVVDGDQGKPHHIQSHLTTTPSEKGN